MRIKTIFLATFAVGMLFLSSCDTTDVPAASPPASSTPVRNTSIGPVLGQSYADTLDGKAVGQDTARFELKLDSGRTLLVQWSDGADSVDLSLYSATGALLVPVVSNSGTLEHAFTCVVPTTGTYWLKARGLAGSRYRFVVDTIPAVATVLPVDGYEVDDSRASAKLLPSDSSIQKRTLARRTPSDPADVDMLRFVADSGRTYRLRLTDVPNSGVVVTMLNSDSARVAASDSLSNGIRTLTFPCSRSGSYYARISRVGGGDLAYGVSLTSAKGSSELPEVGEPDSGVSSAMTMQVDSTPVIRATSYTDDDWIRIPVRKGYGYTVYFTNLNAGTWGWIIASVMDSSGAKICDSINVDSGGDAATRWFEAKEDGARFLRIRSYRLVPYEVRVVEKLLPPDPLEEDSKTAPVVLEENKMSVPRWVRYGWDSDWFRFHADSGRGVILQNYSFGATYLRVYDPSGSEVSITSDRFIPNKTGDFLVDVFGVNTYQEVVPYRFGVRYFPLDTTEPDDGISTARLTHPDSSLISRVVSGYDADWLKIPVLAANVYCIDYAVVEYSPVEFSFYTADSVLLKQGVGINVGYNDGYRGRMCVRAPTDGFIFMRISKEARTSAEGVDLHISHATDEEGEQAHATLATALALAKSDTMTTIGTVLMNGRDVYRFAVDSGHGYRINAPYGTKLIVVDEDSVVQPLNYDALLPKRTGFLYAVVTCRDTTKVVSRYNLKIVHMAPDAFEPDGPGREATPLKTDNSVVYGTLIGEDVDWFVTDLDSNMVLTLVVASRTGSTLALTVTAADGVWVANDWDISGTYPYAKVFEIDRKRRFYFQVQRKDKGQYLDDYVIRATVRPR